MNKIYAQAGMWTWIRGDTSTVYSVVYGTQGIPSPTNSPSGGYEGCEWTDKQGNFWYFGNTTFAFDNNLWKYEPAINMWTWMKGPGVGNDTGSYGIQGVPSLTNNPPSRGFGIASWTDTIGNLWVYGGATSVPQPTTFNDLWKYDISTNEWTWINGSNIPNQPPVYGIQGLSSPLNSPGARSEAACTWVDNANNLWMFGGASSVAGESYNDLWKYNILSNEWTWMKGADSVNSAGVYGIKGLSNPLNTPSGRWCYSNWKDANGNLWLFGGRQFSSTCGYSSLMNDMWKYNISSNEWTWMKGSSAPCDTGITGTKCVADSGSNPASRFENRSNWVDNNGNFWMFGGITWTPTGNPSIAQNDMWMYSVADNKWTWIWGDTIPNQIGSFGDIGITSPCNNPLGTWGSVSWFDSNTNSAYIFAGYEYNTSAGATVRNVLWKYIIDTTCNVYVCPTTGIIEHNSFCELYIFPNPTNSLLSISFESFDNQNIDIRLFNLLGEEVYCLKEKSNSGKFSKQISIEPFSNGIYFLQVKTEEKTMNAKIVKQ